MEDASEELLKKHDLKSGVTVTSVGNGKLSDAGIPEGFIITYVNQEPVESTQQLLNIVSGSNRSILIEGVTSEGEVKFYAIGLDNKK